MQTNGEGDGEYLEALRILRGSNPTPRAITLLKLVKRPWLPWWQRYVLELPHEEVRAKALAMELQYAGETGASLGAVMGAALRKQIIREAEAAPASSFETRSRAAAGSRKPRKSKRTLRAPAPSASKKRPWALHRSWSGISV